MVKWFLMRRIVQMNRRNLIALSIVAALAPSIAFAATPEIFTGLVDGVGAGGYDVVAYFKAGAAMPGEAAMSADYKGAKWYFTSAENLATFQADPAKYAPQYGGYCAYAVSQGATAKGDPEIWTVVDGKLYLNLSQSVQSTWKQDIPGYISSADANWPKVLE
jgi:YHS domain-containing protein